MTTNSTTAIVRDQPNPRGYTIEGTPPIYNAAVESKGRLVVETHPGQWFVHDAKTTHARSLPWVRKT